MDFLPGDRIVINNSWPANRITTVGGINPPFGLDAGDQGVVISETSQGSRIYVVEFDKGPSHFIQISDLWLVLVAKTPPKVESPKQCTCSMPTIMAQGCVCGHIKRYVPPHKRVLEIKKEEAK